MFSVKNFNFTYASSYMYLMIKCGKSGIKAIYNDEIMILLSHGVDKM